MILVPNSDINLKEHTVLLIKRSFSDNVAILPKNVGTLKNEQTKDAGKIIFDDFKFLKSYPMKVKSSINDASANLI